MFFLINRTEFVFKPFHDKIISKLQDIADCKNKKKNLLLNLPVGSGKSILTEFFITWTFARNPSIKHLYVSHSDLLITKLSRETLEIIESPYWQDLFGHVLDQKSSTQYNFMDAGTRSGMTAAPIGSAITGCDAANPAVKGFSGALCFSYDTPILTEKGLMPIGEVVEKKIQVKVWSYNIKEKRYELKPIIAYHKNPKRKMIWFKKLGIKCTPDHKIWTKEGYKLAEFISFEDRFLSMSNFLYLSNRYTKFFRDLFSGIVFIKNKFKIFFGQTFNNFSFIIDRRRQEMCSYVKPFPEFEVNNSSIRNAIFFSYNSNSSFICSNIDDLRIRQRAFEPTSHSSVSQSVLNIVFLSSISQVCKSVIGRISVKMANNVLIRSLSYKCFRNKARDFFIKGFSLFLKMHPFSTLFISINRNKFSFFKKFSIVLIFNISIKRFYNSFIRNLIKTFKTDYIFEHINTPLYSYCVSVKDNHNIFVGKKSILAHNCIDDPTDLSNANSEAVLNETIRLYTDKLKTRLRTKTAPIILMMQRISTNDLAQYVMDAEAEDWDVVKIQAYDEKTKTSFWEEKYPVEMLEKLKIRTPELYYSQYQQEPRATGGSLFTKDMFQIDELPEFFDFTAIVADTAYRGTERSDWTVFLALGKANGRFYVLDIKRARINSDKIVEYFLPFMKHWSSREDFIGTYIEPKGHGIFLNQFFNQEGIPTQSDAILKDFYHDRKRDKVIRANVVLPDIYNFKVTFNAQMEQSIVQDCISECIEFPDGRHDDMVDCIIDGAKLVYKKTPSLLEVI